LSGSRQKRWFEEKTISIQRLLLLLLESLQQLQLFLKTLNHRHQQHHYHDEVLRKLIDEQS
jgi:hypothetical protein